MSNYTLLLIDYDPRTLDLLREPLEAMGYTVAIAKDGDEALAAVRDLKPAMAFVEVMLPKRPGLEVCKEIKETASMQQTKVVAMTSRFSARRYRHKALREFRADEFIEKPIDPTTLHPLLRRLLPGPPPPAVETRKTVPPPAVPRPEAPPAAARPVAPIPVAPAEQTVPRAMPIPEKVAIPAPSASAAPAPASTQATYATQATRAIPVPIPSAPAAARTPAAAPAPKPAAPTSMFGSSDAATAAATEKEIVDHLDSVLSEKLDDLFGD